MVIPNDFTKQITNQSKQIKYFSHFRISESLVGDFNNDPIILKIFSNYEYFKMMKKLILQM